MNKEQANILLDAMRYRAIKEKIDYSEGDDGMTWATLDWCVDVHSLSPLDLDEAIDQIIMEEYENNKRKTENTA